MNAREHDFTLALEVAAGLEPAKTGFADRRLDHFGIATLPLKSHQKTVGGLCRVKQTHTQIYTRSIDGEKV